MVGGATSGSVLPMELDPLDVAPPLHDGRYRLRAVLGEGGMAIVYRAWDRRLEVDRAIKMLLPEMAARPRIRARFEAEARTMARLSHPHIVPVHDVDVDGDRVYIVMELLTGGTLWDRVERWGPMPPQAAVDAVLPALSALAHAHAAGVVHRDVKPQNVLLSAQGVVRLTDFGIARIEDADTRTRTAAVMGTWTYMPPEQRQSARDVDPRSDLYAVGAMLWALTHGREPPDLFAADLDPGLLADLPPPLAEVIRVATRYRPDDRYPDAREMAAALDACRAALPPLDPASPWAPSERVTTVSTGTRSAPPPGSAPRPGSDPAATLPPDGAGAMSPSSTAGARGRATAPRGDEAATGVPATMVPAADVGENVDRGGAAEVPGRRRAGPVMGAAGAVLVAVIGVAFLLGGDRSPDVPPGGEPAPIVSGSGSGEEGDGSVLPPPSRSPSPDVGQPDAPEPEAAAPVPDEGAGGSSSGPAARDPARSAGPAVEESPPPRDEEAVAAPAVDGTGQGSPASAEPAVGGEDPPAADPGQPVDDGGGDPADR
ncbi:MAG: serine/threonine protein kinase, partial [Deltaproteobacteria bacterium]